MVITDEKTNMDDDIDHKSIENILKTYPNRLKLIEYTKPMQVQLGPKKPKKKRTHDLTLQAMKELLANRAERRSKSTLKDIVECNNFDWFITFTFAKNRANVSACKSRLHGWLNSRRRKYGTESFDYVFVPEFHKDGKNIHFHGLIAGNALRMRDSGKKTSYGKPIFNVMDWVHGFSTAVPLGFDLEDKQKAGAYLSKYITKGMPHFSGKKRFWVSRGLVRPYIQHNIDKRSKLYIVRHYISIPKMHIHSSILTYLICNLPVFA